MHNCRHCSQPLSHEVINLGHQPPSNAYLSAEGLEQPEVSFPLKVFVCTQCWLVQLPAHATASELFTPDYAYFSSTSRGWLAHCERYVAVMVERFGLDAQSRVVEIASNDGYLLQFVQQRGIPCLGIEPTGSTAAAARAKGIETVECFLGAATGTQIAASHGQADLIPANNVFAHVPDINDFSAGLAALLAPEGVITLEFPHLLSLLTGLQFDTIYHEHYSYLSLSSASSVLEAAGLRVFDVEELATHGGSLRLFACHAAAAHELRPAVGGFREREEQAQLNSLAAYQALQGEAERIKNDLLAFLIAEQRAGRSVAAYGAAAKGNTLLNFAGVKPDLLPYVCDAAKSKQGRFLPGSHIPILAPNQLALATPRTVLILPWNIAEEVASSMSQVREWGGRFATAVPSLTTF
ncbi:MAG TPA: class I SAM-dependent methyltransferase [Novosphingobium sp.]|nr:class I SAM-dependent methyltransferase [Novosphingobium sp.]